MTDEVLIQFDKVSKSYARRPRTLRDSLQRWLVHEASRRSATAPGALDFLALQEVTFAVHRGETLGIIGPNGAGKSTILKLIAGITAPSTGRVSVRGRVGTLIELGAGFHQDLTGRENIYLNGTLLGLRRCEIDERFDDIVRFSGLAEFLDVPVKYYSSGMYAKLGFAIAAHIEADVLLTDEILAVGDVAFQRQCLKAFEGLQAHTTIVFVSHDLAAIKRVCSRVVWMDHGTIKMVGLPDRVTEAYLDYVQQERETSLRTAQSIARSAPERRGTGEIQIEEVTTYDGDGYPRIVFKTDDALIVRLAYSVKGAYRDPGFCINIQSKDGVFIHGTNTFGQGLTLKMGDRGLLEVRYPKLPLLPGTYWLAVGATAGNDWSKPYDFLERVTQFEVFSLRPDGGLTIIEHEWIEMIASVEQRSLSRAGS